MVVFVESYEMLEWVLVFVCYFVVWLEGDCVSMLLFVYVDGDLVGVGLWWIGLGGIGVMYFWGIFDFVVDVFLLNVVVDLLGGNVCVSLFDMLLLSVFEVEVLMFMLLDG